ncbi:MAG: DUF397 domain-containing protein [Nocardioides sp.]
MERNNQNEEYKAPAVEEFTDWRKSKTSDDGGCVFIADGPDGWVALRESSDPAGTVVRIPRNSWDHFSAGIMNGSINPREV